LAEAWNGTSWEVQTTPNPFGSTDSELYGVSCTDGDACTAVGFFNVSSGKTKTLAEAWDGSSWSIQPTPKRTRTTAAELFAVSCTASDACTAVGSSYASSSGRTVTLAEAWDGTSWSVQATPSPTGDTNAYLQGVSCTTADACTAVGYSVTPSGVAAALAEARDGTSWSVQATATLAGATYSSLSGVSCTASGACTAVGSDTSSSKETETLAEVWDGTSWSVQATPNPTGAIGDTLSGVSCTAGGSCTAVGSSATSSGKTLTLAEARGATSWKIQATGIPSGATSSYLQGVSCTAGDSCTAVGYDISSSGIVAPLTEARTGTSWRVLATPDPAGAIGSELSGASCTATKTCTAVGSYYIDTSGVVVTLAEAWNGSSWKVQATPRPAGATTSELSGVSCADTDSCTAVGYDGGTSELVTLAEAWNGTSWQIQATPNPPGAKGSQLFGVSCATSDECTAVGYDTNSSGETVTLAEAWNGSSWTIRSTPNPAGAATSHLYGVWCATADACTAVGYETNTSGETVTLAEAWNGSSWTIQATPNPAGAARGSGLFGVSCHGADACTAVGYDTNSSDVVATLVESWNGTSWTIRPSPNPTGSSESELSGVSCVAAGACTAVGFNTNSSGRLVTLAEVLNGSSWSVQTTPNPNDAPVSELSGVSCTSADACTAAGFHTKSSGTGATLAEAES